MTDLQKVFHDREQQLNRVLAQIEHKTKEEAIAIILCWMPMEQVESMLKLWEGTS